MKLILDAEGVKREIRAPFTVCADIDDLRRFVLTLRAVLLNWEHEGVSSGWFEINPVPERSINTPPRKWAD